MQWLFRVCSLHRPMEPKCEITWLRPRFNIGHWNHEKTHVQVRHCIHSSYRSDYSKKEYTFEQPLSKALLSGLSIKREQPRLLSSLLPQGLRRTFSLAWGDSRLLISQFGTKSHPLRMRISKISTGTDSYRRSRLMHPGRGMTEPGI